MLSSVRCVAKDSMCTQHRALHDISPMSEPMVNCRHSSVVMPGLLTGPCRACATFLNALGMLEGGCKEAACERVDSETHQHCAAQCLHPPAISRFAQARCPAAAAVQQMTQGISMASLASGDLLESKSSLKEHFKMKARASPLPAASRRGGDLHNGLTRSEEHPCIITYPVA